MYCLDCGTKIQDDELQCPNCGSSVALMQERIAAAAEKITYTDAVGSTQTSKLPLVSQRAYFDRRGNPIDPSNKVDVSSLRSSHDLSAIPELGDADPYITKPMQRIVSDSGEVVADVDREVKMYRQASSASHARSHLILALVLVALALIAVAIGVVVFVL